MLKNKRKKKNIKLRAYKGFPLVLRNNILETGNGIFFFFEIETLLLLNKKWETMGKKANLMCTLNICFILLIFSHAMHACGCSKFDFPYFYFLAYPVIQAEVINSN